MKFYKGLYFSIYRFCKKYLGEDDIPEFKASNFLTLVEFFWATNIFLALGLITNNNIGFQDLSVFGLVIFFAAVGLFNWSYFVKSEKYLTMELDYVTRESKLLSLINLLVIIGSVYFTVILAYFSTP